MKGWILDLVEKKIDEMQYNSVLAQFVLSKDETWNIVLCRFVFNVEPPQENKTHVKTENFAIEDFSLSLTEFKEFLTYLKDSNTDEVVSEINNEPESAVLYKFGSYNLCFVGTCPVAELEFYGRNETARLHGIPKPVFYTDYYIMNKIGGRIPRDVDLGNLEIPFKDCVDAINHHWGTTWEHHHLNNNPCRFFMPIYDASIAKASLKNGREFHIKLELNPKTKQEDLSLSVIAKAEGHNYSERHSIVTNPLIIDIKFTPNDATILLYKHGEKLDEYQYYDSTGLAGEVLSKTEKSKKILNNKTKQKKLKLLSYHTNEGTINWSKLGFFIGIPSFILGIIAILIVTI